LCLCLRVGRGYCLATEVSVMMAIAPTTSIGRGLTD